MGRHPLPSWPPVENRHVKAIIGIVQEAAACPGKTGVVGIRECGVGAAARHPSGALSFSRDGAAG